MFNHNTYSALSQTLDNFINLLYNYSHKDEVEKMVNRNLIIGMLLLFALAGGYYYGSSTTHNADQKEIDNLARNQSELLKDRDALLLNQSELLRTIGSMKKENEEYHKTLIAQISDAATTSGQAAANGTVSTFDRIVGVAMKPLQAVENATSNARKSTENARQAASDAYNLTNFISHPLG
jgi:hypothetical protein